MDTNINLSMKSVKNLCSIFLQGADQLFKTGKNGLKNSNLTKKISRCVSAATCGCFHFCNNHFGIMDIIMDIMVLHLQRICFLFICFYLSLFKFCKICDCTIKICDCTVKICDCTVQLSAFILFFTKVPLINDVFPVFPLSFFYFFRFYVL